METSMSDSEQSILDEIKNIIAKNEVLQNKLDEANKNAYTKAVLKQALLDEVQVLEDEITSRKDENKISIKKTQLKQIEKLNYEKEILISDIESLKETNKSIDLKIIENDKQNEPIKFDNNDFQALYSIQEENTIFQNILEELQKNYDESLDSVKEIQIFELKSLQESHQEVLSSYNIFKNNIKNFKCILEEAEEHNALLSNELATLKAGVDKEDNCTSLFSEVEDKRQIILKKVKDLVTECEKLKQHLGRENNAINVIKRENTMLEMLFEDRNKFEEFKKEVNLAAEQRISDLESFISSLKKRPKTQQIITVSASDINFDWMHTLVKKMQLEVVNLDKRYESCFQQLVEYQFKLEKAKKLRKEAMDTHSDQTKQIAEMKVKLASPPVQPTSYKPNKTITFAEGTKE